MHQGFPKPPQFFNHLPGAFVFSQGRIFDHSMKVQIIKDKDAALGKITAELFHIAGILRLRGVNKNQIIEPVSLKLCDIHCEHMDLSIQPFRRNVGNRQLCALGIIFQSVNLNQR